MPELKNQCTNVQFNDSIRKNIYTVYKFHRSYDHVSSEFKHYNYSSQSQKGKYKTIQNYISNDSQVTRVKNLKSMALKIYQEFYQFFSPKFPSTSF